MRTFIDERQTTSEDTDLHFTNCYVEVETPLDTNTSSYFYLIPKTETSVFVATCWDDAFDKLLQGDEGDLEIVADTWPTLASLLSNGVQDKYRDCAMIRLSDLDDGDQKWFLASVAGNIKLDNADELLGDRTMEVAMKVVARTAELLNELQTRSPSAWKQIGKFAAGVGIALLLGAFGIDGPDT
jgi:hypothetical protein